MYTTEIARRERGVNFKGRYVRYTSNIIKVTTVENSVYYILLGREYYTESKQIYNHTISIRPGLSLQFKLCYPLDGNSITGAVACTCPDWYWVGAENRQPCKHMEHVMYDINLD